MFSTNSEKKQAANPKLQEISAIIQKTIEKAIICKDFLDFSIFSQVTSTTRGKLQGKKLRNRRNPRTSLRKRSKNLKKTRFFRGNPQESTISSSLRARARFPSRRKYRRKLLKFRFFAKFPRKRPKNTIISARSREVQLFSRKSRKISLKILRKTLRKILRKSFRRALRKILRKKL